jgi:outer membrane murein-binding lipoprotein Lpp
MNAPLASLEQKVELVVALCQELRAENLRLQDRVDALESEKQALAERMTTARQRLEGIMDKLPAEE